MKIFPSESIKSKITLILFLAAGIAILLTSTAFFVIDLYRFNGELNKEIKSLADVTGSNSTAALEFMDVDVGRETLNALENYPNILAAYIYTDNGKMLASFERDSKSYEISDLDKDRKGSILRDDYRSFKRPIMLDGVKIGNIYLVADLMQARESLKRYLAVAALILMVNLLLIYLLSVSFQKIISGPISSLAEIAGKVSKTKDYSIRATKISNDEIGYMVDQFNDMLDKIERRDEALQSAHADLEGRVKERTKELEKEVYERKRVSEVLRESQKMLSLVMDNIPQAIYWKDNNSVYLGCNKTFARHAGLSYPSDIFGKTDDDMPWTDEEKGKCLDAEQRVIEKGSPEYHSVETQRQNDNKHAMIEVNRIPLFDSEQNIVGLLGTYEDITERSAMEEDLTRAQRLESLGVLAGGIAHDFNNLLTGIVGNITLSQMLIESGEDVTERLKDAEIAAMRAKDLTMQLLTFSRGGEPIKKIVILPDLLNQSANLSLRGSNVVCKFDLDEDLWPVEVDEGQITQVINNILINANQAMPSGGSVTLKATNVEIDGDGRFDLDSGRYVRVTIRDEGIGIPEEYLDRIFDPYFTTKKEGHGLGLASSFSIIKKHGGVINVLSELGKGSEFTFYIPASDLIKEFVKDDKAVFRNGGGNILVMDDEEIIRKTAGKMLIANGYNVEFAKEGKEAIELYKGSMEKGEKYDVIILDLTIPGGLGGKDTITELVKIDPEVKAIVSSGYSNDPVMADYKNYGFREFVPKPYSSEQLLEVVGRLMESG